jgi:murein DD-endopeptidase MepM/ murein hydrolase activator NlpD
MEVEKPSIAPVNLTKSKNGDGYRIHSATKENKMHNGIDFILAEGESVFATADGVLRVHTEEHSPNHIYTTKF